MLTCSVDLDEKPAWEVLLHEHQLGTPIALPFGMRLLLAVAWVSLHPPPYVARLMVDSAYVRKSPEASAPTIGLLRRGDEVTILSCVPQCAAANAWAILKEGAVRAALLRPKQDDDAPVATVYDYGRVLPGGARVRLEAKEGARTVEHRRAGQDLAFLPDGPLRAAGWLQRVYGGFIRADEIRPSTASAFVGQPKPTLPVGFVIKDRGGHHRYDRAPIIAIGRARVTLPDGVVPRDSVRIASLHARPTAIPEGARWVHVSVDEQVLVAYEGDTPVYATLVSTGLKEHPTPIGLFRIYDKEIHSSMHGEPPEPYYVDEVPFVEYFRKGISLHGTFWHDRFGRRASHGCVNLSMADAQWLFDWAPPKLPQGWHSIEPDPAGLSSLWVLVTR